MERANEDSEKALVLQTKRWNQTREAHEDTVDTLRTELSQVCGWVCGCVCMFVGVCVYVCAYVCVCVCMYVYEPGVRSA